MVYNARARRLQPSIDIEVFGSAPNTSGAPTPRGLEGENPLALFVSSPVNWVPISRRSRPTPRRQSPTLAVDRSVRRTQSHVLSWKQPKIARRCGPVSVICEERIAFHALFPPPQRRP